MIDWWVFYCIAIIIKSKIKFKLKINLILYFSNDKNVSLLITIVRGYYPSKIWFNWLGVFRENCQNWTLFCIFSLKTEKHKMRKQNPQYVTYDFWKMKQIFKLNLILWDIMASNSACVFYQYILFVVKVAGGYIKPKIESRHAMYDLC